MASVAPASELHRLPGDEPQRDTVLAHGDLIVGVELPPRFGGRSRYRKVRDRASYAFALVSLGAIVRQREGVIDDLRLVLGGVAHKPWRARRAEDALRGKEPSVDVFRIAADAELLDADALADNGFKIPLVHNTMVSVLRELTEGSS